MADVPSPSINHKYLDNHYTKSVLHIGKCTYTPLLIKPKCTEPYYTRTVLLIAEYRHTEIPRADGPPPIDPKCTEPYYTRMVLPIAECRCTEIPRADVLPPIEPKST